MTKTDIMLPPNFIPSTSEAGWSNPFRPDGYSVKPGGGQTYTVSVSPTPISKWPTSTTQVRVEYIKDGVKVSELHTIPPDGGEVKFTVTTDDTPIMGAPAVYIRNLTPIPTAVRFDVSRDLLFRRNAGSDIPSDADQTADGMPQKPADHSLPDSGGDKPPTGDGGGQGTSTPRDSAPRGPIVIPRSTFNLFGDLTTMTTAALERERRESRLVYDGLTDGEAYRVLTDGAGQVASRFEPGNQPDLDVAQAGGDVTRHGGGRFVPRGNSDTHDATSDSAIPEPRVKPDTYRMLPGRSTPVPAAKPDLYGLLPEKANPILRAKPLLPGARDQ